MTLEKIRLKTQELRAKTRRGLLGGMILPLAVAAIAGWGVKWFDSPMLRLVFAAAIAWSVAGQYFANRGMWPEPAPDDPAVGTGIESYRRELERRRYLSARFLLWYFGPMVLAIAALTVPALSLGMRRGMLLNMIPFLSLLFIWLVSVFVMRLRDRRELQREIDELDKIERAAR